MSTLPSSRYLLVSIHFIHFSSETRIVFFKGILKSLTFNYPPFFVCRGKKNYRPIITQCISTQLFEGISLPDLDIFIRGREHFSLCGNLHGPRFTEDREFIPGLPRYRRPVRRLPGYDICRGERSPRLLGIRAAILRHLDRLRRYVQHCLYFESLRDLSRSLHTHKGSSQIRSLGDEKGRRCWDRCSVVARRTHILRPYQPRPSPCK